VIDGSSKRSACAASVAPVDLMSWSVHARPKAAHSAELTGTRVAVFDTHPTGAPRFVARDAAHPSATIVTIAADARIGHKRECAVLTDLTFLNSKITASKSKRPIASGAQVCDVVDHFYHEAGYY
jgi:hypothetical protein